MAEQTKVELKVTPRDVLGKKVSRLRREGVIPANVYGHGLDSVAIQVPKDELVHVMRTAGRNEIVYLRLDGEEPRPTFLRQVQRNPVTDAILHADFYQISLKEKVRLEVRLHQLTRAVPESHVARGEVPCPDERKGTVMRRLIESTKGEAVDLIEGVRVRRGEEWVAAIPDADRACFHIVAEGLDGERARALVEEFRDRIVGWRKEQA